jgi:hypothetical protein
MEGERKECAVTTRDEIGVVAGGAVVIVDLSSAFLFPFVFVFNCTPYSFLKLPQLTFFALCVCSRLLQLSLVIIFLCF